MALRRRPLHILLVYLSVAFAAEGRNATPSSGAFLWPVSTFLFLEYRIKSQVASLSNANDEGGCASLEILRAFLRHVIPDGECAAVGGGAGRAVGL